MWESAALAEQLFYTSCPSLQLLHGEVSHGGKQVPFGHSVTLRVTHDEGRLSGIVDMLGETELGFGRILLGDAASRIPDAEVAALSTALEKDGATLVARGEEDSGLLQCHFKTTLSLDGVSASSSDSGSQQMAIEGTYQMFVVQGGPNAAGKRGRGPNAGKTSPKHDVNKAKVKPRSGGGCCGARPPH